MYYQKSANTIHFRNRDFEGREGGGIQNSAAVLFRILVVVTSSEFSSQIDEKCVFLKYVTANLFAIHAIYQLLAVRR